MRNYLESKEIQLKVTKKHSPEEVGLAERINKKIIEVINNSLPDFPLWYNHDLADQ